MRKKWLFVITIWGTILISCNLNSNTSGATTTLENEDPKLELYDSLYVSGLTIYEKECVPCHRAKGARHSWMHVTWERIPVSESNEKLELFWKYLNNSDSVAQFDNYYKGLKEDYNHIKSHEYSFSKEEALAILVYTNASYSYEKEQGIRRADSN